MSGVTFETPGWRRSAASRRGGQLGAGDEELVLEPEDVAVELAAALGGGARRRPSAEAASSIDP